MNEHWRNITIPSLRLYLQENTLPRQRNLRSAMGGRLLNGVFCTVFGGMIFMDVDGGQSTIPEARQFLRNGFPYIASALSLECFMQKSINS